MLLSPPPNAIAIVGRPNVGKSTLFNRLASKNKTIVNSIAGVTRDYVCGQCINSGLCWTVIDTAGFNEDNDLLSSSAMEQTIKAIGQTQAILLLIDGTEGALQEDQYWARFLKKNFGTKRVIVVINKCDHKISINAHNAAYQLGFSEEVHISAEHGTGITSLLDKIQEYAVAEKIIDTEEYRKQIKTAIIGRPNVGKSTLVNRIVKENRMITGATPGLTRDAVEVSYEYKGHAVTLLDTAGLRKQSNIHLKLEKQSAASTINAINHAHVVVLVLDSTMGIEKQDTTIMRFAVQEGKALVVVINKWDLVVEKKQYIRQMQDFFVNNIGTIKSPPIIPLSALYGKTDRLMDTIVDIFTAWNCRVSTGALNRWLAAAINKHAPKLHRGKPVNFKYISQVDTRPPTFYISTNVRNYDDNDYRKYLTNSLYKDFNFIGTPLRIKFKK